MKRFYLALVAVLIGIATVGLFGLTRMASAYSFHTGNDVTLSKNSIDDTVYAAGRTVDISSEVYGDVFCTGQNVTITGTVHGDVICAGQTVNITGRVDGDVRLIGQSITLGAPVQGNATVGGQSFTLTSLGSVNGDLTAGAADTTLNGRVRRDVVVGGSNLIVGNTVGRNIKAQVNTMHLTSRARVGGSIALTSQHTLSRENGSTVSGTVTRTNPSQTAPSHRSILGFGLVWFVYWLVAMLVTAIVLVLLFPRLFQSVTNRAMPRPWKALLTGFVAFFVAPIIILLFAASVIGLPLAFITGMLWLLLLLLSEPVFAYYLGRLILRGSKRPFLYMLVGAIALTILYFIPVVDVLVALAAAWIGTGTLLLDAFHKNDRLVLHEISPEPKSK